MRVIAAINTALDVGLAVRVLFDAPTVAQLVPRIGAGGGALDPLVVAKRPAVVPLSFAQNRLWFLDQLHGPSPVYNMPVALRLSGRLDANALGAALADLVGRHESLRTVFAAMATLVGRSYRAATATRTKHASAVKSGSNAQTWFRMQHHFPASSARKLTTRIP